MRIILEDVPDELGRELLKLLANSDVTAAQVTHEWTPAKAETLLRDLPYSAQVILRKVVARNGWCSAEAFRGEENASLRGRTGAITKAISRGVRTGRLPEGMPPPLTAQYDPNITSYQRTSGFAMPEEHIAAFREAFDRIDDDLRVEAEALAKDPVDQKAVQAVQADMESLRAW